MIVCTETDAVKGGRDLSGICHLMTAIIELIAVTIGIAKAEGESFRGIKGIRQERPANWQVG